MKSYEILLFTVKEKMLSFNCRKNIFNSYIRCASQLNKKWKFSYKRMLLFLLWALGPRGSCGPARFPQLRTGPQLRAGPQLQRGDERSAPALTQARRWTFIRVSARILPLNDSSRGGKKPLVVMAGNLVRTFAWTFPVVVAVGLSCREWKGTWLLGDIKYFQTFSWQSCV